MRIKLQDLQAKSLSRPEGYYADVVSKGVISGDTLEISVEDLNCLIAKYRPVALPGESAPCPQCHRLHAL